MLLDSPNRSNLLALSGAYFAFFSILGLVVPYLSVWLESLGYDSVAIGETLAVFSIMRVVAPPLWARLADKSGKHVLIARIGAMLALVMFTSLFWVDGYPLRMLSLAAFSFFWTAILPQIESMTLRSLGDKGHQYAHIRLWGSIGFICISVGVGYLLDLAGNRVFLYAGTSLLVLLSLMLIPVKQLDVARNEQQNNQTSGSWFNWVFILFLAANLFSYASHGPYYSFFVLQLSDLGYSNTVAGIMMAIGVIGELAIFMVMGRLLKRWRSVDIFAVSLILTAIRWVLIGWFADNVLVLVVAQSLHAASFATAHASCINWMNERVPQHSQSTAQALYAACGFGGGSVVGAWLAGQLWMNGEGVIPAYATAVGLALFAWTMSVAMQIHERRTSPVNV